MPKFQVLLHNSDGTDEIYDDYGTTEWDTYEEADEAGLEYVGAGDLGSEILFASNPGDYDEYEDSEVTYEVIEKED